MSDLIQSVQDMLKEETWTRATISNYTQNNLKELTAIYQKAKESGELKEIKSLCDEQLSHSKDSIIALYFSGMCDVHNGALDNSSLETLVDIFQKNRKTDIVIFLCTSILADSPNNKFALRTLAATYQAEDGGENQDKIWELYDKIVKLDFQEADLAKVLGEHYSAEGSKDEKKAVDYFKKAIIRYINNGNYMASKEIWSKLINLSETNEDKGLDYEYFQLIRRKLSKTFGDMKTSTLLQELYARYKKTGCKWNNCIEILKQMLDVDATDGWARKEITACYKNKYKDNALVDEYLHSTLEANYRNVFEAINDFEKHIAFTKGGFVYHRSWGVGIISQMDKDSLTINFGKAAGIHEMKLSMAVSALKPLSKNHIWVLKARKNKEALTAWVKGQDLYEAKLAKLSADASSAQKKKEADKKAKEFAEKKSVERTLKTIITSFDNACDFKKIKAELVPAVFDTKEWTSWNTKAKKELAENPIFGINPANGNEYIVRDRELTSEEKLANEFKAQKQFFARADIIMKYFNDETNDRSNENFTEMFTYFSGYLKNISKVDEEVLASYLIVKHIGVIDPQFTVNIKETFAQIYAKIEDPRDTYTKLKDSKNTNLRDEFLEDIKLLPDWQNEYIRLFPTVLNIKMINTLIAEGFEDDVIKLVKTAFDQYKDYRETVLFFFKDCQNYEWYKKSGITMDKQLVTLINLIVLTFREINSHVNTTENKKINKNATELLFDSTDGKLLPFMLASNDLAKKFYTMIDDIDDLDPSIKQAVRIKILDKYPDFKFRITEDKSKQKKAGIIVTAKKLEEKRAEAENIEKVELPRVNGEVAYAKAKGDLKENQEYKAAKEEQHMLSLTLSRLQSEIAQAVVFDPSMSTTSVVSFGTVVTLSNKDSGKDEVYTILGPWESDPENNILSYVSPKAAALMDAKLGDDLYFAVNDVKYHYTVKKIEKANIQ
jgi:transcription elongation factor GreA-like protein/transcription elongation GreA/GreB family factor